MITKNSKQFLVELVCSAKRLSVTKKTRNLTLAELVNDVHLQRDELELLIPAIHDALKYEIFERAVIKNQHYYTLLVKGMEFAEVFESIIDTGRRVVPSRPTVPVQINSEADCYAPPVVTVRSDFASLLKAKQQSKVAFSGAKLKAFRERMKMSTAVFAKATGVSAVGAYQRENSEGRIPRRGFWEKIAGIAECSVEEAQVMLGCADPSTQKAPGGE